MHVFHAVHVTDTLVHTVHGVHDHTVSTQYLVVDHQSFDVNVTVWSVDVRVLFALSVVTGANVSIHVRVIVKFTVLHSLSFACITHVSLHVWFAFGVYVIHVVPACVHVHLLQFVTIVLYDISHAQHAQSTAFDVALQSAVFAAFQIFVQYVKLFAVGELFINVYHVLFDVLFHNASLTHHVAIVTTFAWAAVITVLVVVFHVLQSKLYGVACNHTHHQSLAHAILKLHAVHSGQLAALNVYVGAVWSSTTFWVISDVVLFNQSLNLI